MSRRVLRRVVAPLLVVALAAAATVVYATGVSSSMPVVTVVFPDATGVTLGFQVRSRGALVGDVSAVRVIDGKAELDLTVDEAVYPIREDATAWIRPVNLLGERYIELDPGSPAAPIMSEPLRLSEARTRSSATFQDVLDTLDDPTSTALAATVTTLGEGLEGVGPQAADAIKALAPAMTDANRLASILRDQNDVLGSLIDRTRPVTRGLANGEGRPLDRLLTTTEQTLGTVANNRKALNETLAELPATVQSARTALGKLSGAARSASPTLDAIRPTTDDLSEITGELHGLAETADPAVTSLRPVLDRADELLDRAAPVVDQLRKAGPDLRQASKDLRPLGDQLLDRHLKDLMDFVRQWSLSTNDEDGLSHYFRGVVFVTPTTLEQIIGGAPLPGVSRPPSTRALLPGGAQLSAATPPVPRLPAVGAVPGLVPETPSDPVRRGPAPLGGATGLTQQQERSMLGQLIGGQ